MPQHQDFIFGLHKLTIICLFCYAVAIQVKTALVASYSYEDFLHTRSSLFEGTVRLFSDEYLISRLWLY